MNGSWKIGLAAFLVSVSGMASAEAWQTDPATNETLLRLGQEPYLSLYPDGVDAFLDRVRFVIAVPIKFDQMVRTYSVNVYCEVESSLLPNSEVVGRGGAMIMADHGGPILELVSELENDDIRSALNRSRDMNWYQADFTNGTDMTVTVPILSVASGDASGWTHGRCRLHVKYYPSDGGSVWGGTPVDCLAEEEEVDFALCSRPGTPLVTFQQFGREGYDAIGRPLNGGN